MFGHCYTPNGKAGANEFIVFKVPVSIAIFREKSSKGVVPVQVITRMVRVIASDSVIAMGMAEEFVLWKYKDRVPKDGFMNVTAKSCFCLFTNIDFCD